MQGVASYQHRVTPTLGAVGLACFSAQKKTCAENDAARRILITVEKPVRLGLGVG